METVEYLRNGHADSVQSAYQESPIQLKPFYHTDLKKTLETVITDKEPEPKNFINRIFTDKSKSLKSTVKALFSEITLREYLNSHLLYRINQDICRQHTYMMNLENLSLSYSPELSKDLNNTKMQLESKVLDLEKEKRKEYLECWRDLMFLKKYLFASLKEYWDMSKRKDALSYRVNE